LIFMAIMMLIIGYLYIYNIWGFIRFALDAVFMIAIGYFFTAIAAIVLPKRLPDVWNRAPASRYKIAGVPLVSLSGLIFAIFLLWIMYMWAVDPIYGVNDPVSALYLLANYIASAIIFYGFKWYRKKQGIEVEYVYKEIPVE